MSPRVLRRVLAGQVSVLPPITLYNGRRLGGMGSLCVYMSVCVPTRITDNVPRLRSSQACDALLHLVQRKPGKSRALSASPLEGRKPFDVEDVQSDWRLFITVAVVVTAARRKHGCLYIVFLDCLVEQLFPVGVALQWPHDDEPVAGTRRRRSVQIDGSQGEAQLGTSVC